MKKKFVILTAALALVGLAAVSFSLAFFTDTETADNVVTTGNVNIAVDESITVDYYNEHKAEQGWNWNVAYDEKGKSLTYQGIVPGDRVSHITDINNTGKNDAYLRLRVETVITDKSSKELSTEGIKFLYNSNEVKFDENGYYYYDKILKTYNKDDPYYEDVVRVFDQVSFPPSWGNEYAGAKIEIKITAEAIQSDNVDVGSMTGADATREAFKDKVIKEYSKK